MSFLEKLYSFLIMIAVIVGLFLGNTWGKCFCRCSYCTTTNTHALFYVCANSSERCKAILLQQKIHDYKHHHELRPDAGVGLAFGKRVSGGSPGVMDWLYHADGYALYGLVYCFYGNS